MSNAVCGMQNPMKESPRFSPVTLTVSPGAKVSQGTNLTGNPRLVRDIAAEIHSSIQQWNALHLNGVSLLKTITRLKVDQSYPEELKTPCEDLEKICDEADKIVANLELLAKQVKAVSCLHKTDNNLFSTWPVEKFVMTAETIYNAYKKEAAVKRIILENVAHNHRDSWKMLHLAAWVHQTQISDNINTKLESMLIETKLR
ncbi:hypothetical protein TSAR_013201 [Trichomalopsis sarcophagae]|uniref:Cyclin-dependent kinase 2-interacting protein n=1 Tax=Trichomalopsis sarcophagae TaxID=543379 RepID=A0A232F7A4_9HYME|nr:hypothetical protein TSAR_013201 [Trichomalopsis sarcophagae]